MNMPFDPDKAIGSFQSLRKSLRPMSKHPSPDRVHKLRTRTRRVEAIVNALMIDHKKERKRLLRALTPIRKQAGDARDMDVFIGLTAAIPIECEQECLVQLIEHIGSERAKAVRKLRRTLSAQRKKAIVQLKETAERIEKASSPPRTQRKQNREWSADATAAAVAVWDELTAWPRLNSTNLHPFRIKAKELRYMLQLSVDDGRFLRALGEVKDAIGEWHDWNELAAIASAVLSHGKHCPVVKQMRATAKQKFDHALFTANCMRKTYENGKIDWLRPLEARTGARIPA